MTRETSLGSLVVLACGAVAPFVAGAAEQGDIGDAGQVIVTGTRAAGLKADDSPAPVQVLDEGTLRRVGQPDILQAITQNVPAFTVQANGGDTQNLTVAAALRGLNPNNTLVLIDGKRRHGTANLSIDGGAGPYQGSAAPDWSFIPAAAIDHIEVLTDGAAAQYGTDAIAGVINVILKHDAGGLDATLSDGRYYAGDGTTPDLSVNGGFAIGNGGFVNLTAESRFHDFTDRGNIDPRALDPGQLASTPTITKYPGYPHVNRVDGDALYHLDLFAFNAAMPVSSSASLYAFGTAGRKTAESFENYRTPDVLPPVYPNGFEPLEALSETDYAATLGIKGQAAEWNWDLSTTYGTDRDGIDTIHSANLSLYQNTGSTPLSAHDGNFITTQWTTNLDFVRTLNAGLATPVTLAFGAEYRRDTYEIDAGDYAATYQEGMQSFPGFTKTDAGRHSRDNQAVYADISANLTDQFKVDIAGRTEHYSDFGSATVGKLTGRYDFNPAFALRGTVSNGFRAPTLAEEYYSATNVNINSAFVQLPPNSYGATFVGVDGLRPEKSTNFSVGIVAHPIERLTATLDAYQITVRDRIAASGAVFASGFGGSSSAVAQAIQANGNVINGVTNFGIQIFANGIDTRTRGLEFVASYPTELGSAGRIDWSLTGNVNTTEILSVHAVSSQLTAALGGQALYGPGALSDIASASPKYRAVLTGRYSVGPVVVTVRESVFGASAEKEQGDDGNFYPTVVHAAPLTDLDFEYHVTQHVAVSVGANNLFDRRPNSYNPALIANYRANLDAQSVLNSPGFAPFSINGGYYYAKLRLQF